MTFPTVPDFAVLFASAAAFLIGASLALVLVIALPSRQNFEGSLIRTLRDGKLRASAFYALATLQFVIAAGFLIAINDVRFVDNDLGLGAYEGSNTTRFDARLELTEVCGWRDIYPYERMGQLLFGEEIPLRDPNVAVPDKDPRFVEFDAFMSDLESQFRGQAPDAIFGLTERLNPIFAILSGFFVIVARSIFQREKDTRQNHPLPRTLGTAILAFAFLMLGYFVILGYHALTEVSAAFASGRVLCISHVAPFYVAQTQALVAATVGLLLLFILSPVAIFRRL